MEKLFVPVTLSDYGNRTVYLEVFNETNTFYETRKCPNLKIYSNSDNKKGLPQNKIRWPKKDVKAVSQAYVNKLDTSCVFYDSDLI